MKIKGFRVSRFLSSSPNCYGVGKSRFIYNNHIPPLSLSIFRCFGTKFVLNCNYLEKLKSVKGLNDALRLYDNMSRMRPLPSVIQFNQLLSRVVNLKEYSAAIHLFEDISCNLGVSVDEYTMNIAINSYCLSNRVNYGFSILGWFFKRGCVPNEITFGTLLKGLFRGNKINEAQELFRKMVREGLCELNVVTYNMLIDGLCKDKMIDFALNLFDEMSKKGICPDVMTFSSLIDSLCKEGLVDEAEDMLQIMKQQNVNPNVFSYNSLMDGYCLQGRMDEARNVFDSSMASKNLAPNVWSYSILINGYCRKKKIDEAMHMFREMPRKGVKPNMATYNTILQGLFRCGRDSCALKLFDELQADGLKPDFYTYCNMLDGLCRNGQVERASLFLDALERKEGEHLHIAYYTIVMDGFCKAKKIDVARAIFRDLTAKAVAPNVVTYNSMIKGCCQNGLLEEAKDLLLRMEQISLSPDEITYNSIIQGNLKGGRYEDASRLFEEMCAKGFSQIHLHLNCCLIYSGQQNKIQLFLI
ncbi:pentatricopeptide repeat-containing protein at1g62670 mitochondrial [Phtheirospermum japonicum]|uniref:Pentatricopeptide repeat-containing protein at1g62670 mitochondrial n=1 Tax=Phtheirospermum japonicum TaxID=374723 RepID=A0A830CU10_9LAMI|nr:pentatricopeptide repeat-containing protein at1g62670 mitochondrial [Phtheirospermum japonicum]